MYTHTQTWLCFYIAENVASLALVCERDIETSLMSEQKRTCNVPYATRSLPQPFNSIDRILSVSVGQHEGEANDYYFRDSFDHSSSESQLLDASGKPHSRSVTPVPKMQKLQNSKLCLQQQQQHHQQQHHQGVRRTTSVKLRHKSHVIRLFIPAFMLTITVLFIVTVVVFETDTTLFDNMRKMPEMVALRSQYYIPIKEFLRTKLGLFWCDARLPGRGRPTSSHNSLSLQCQVARGRDSWLRDLRLC